MARNAQLNLEGQACPKGHSLKSLRRKIGGRLVRTLRSYLRIMLKAYLKSAPSKIVRGPSKPNLTTFSTL